MDFKNLKNEHSNDRLSNEQWEKIAQQLINTKFDEQKQGSYQKKLKQEGIYRIAPSNNKRILIRRGLFIAASLLFLLTIGWYLLPSSSSNAKQLANQYLEQPFVINDGNVRGHEEIEKTKGKALEAYNNQHYDKALEYLQIIESQDKAHASEYFQMGLCLIYKSKPNYKNALSVFEKAQTLNPLIYEDEINWFSALCNILLSNKSEAKRLLNQIIQSPGSRQQKAAKKLLKKLIHDKHFIDAAKLQ